MIKPSIKFFLSVTFALGIVFTSLKLFFITTLIKTPKIDEIMTEFQLNLLCSAFLAAYTVYSEHRK